MTPLATARADAASATPIYDWLVEQVAKSLDTKAKGQAANERRRRAAQIRDGSCPPWRTDVTIPPGYEGAP